MADKQIWDSLGFNHTSLSQTTNTGWADVDDTYATVGAPNADQVEIGLQGTAVTATYLMAMSATYEINSTGNSVQARFSLDGGSTWENFSRESKDSTDRQSMDYLFPVNLSGAYDFVFQMKKENASNALQVHFANLWLERKTAS